VEGKMGLKIIYGKPGSGKSTYCFQEIANCLETEKKIYMITPEQFSFTAEEKLMKTVKRRAVLTAEVVTLSRMAYRVLEEIGGSSKTHLSKQGKSMLIYSILNQNKKELKFLGKSDENIDLAMNAITEFKKHAITSEDLKQEIEQVEDPLLKTKLSDMLVVYEKFQEQIEGKYIEETDLLNLLEAKIEETDLIKDAILYFDEFAGFTKQEYQVIEKFVKLAKQVNITICCDDLNTNSNPDTDIFFSNKVMIAKIWSMVNENDFSLEEPVHLTGTYRFKSEELRHLSENMNQQQSTKYEEKVENLSLFLAQNPYEEIEEIAKKITQLIRNEKMRYKEIAIITKEIDGYASLVRAIFSKYQIPVFIDEKRDVSQNIIIQYVLAILEVISKNFMTEAVFNYLKLGFSNIEEDEIFELENYCNKWGIKQNKWKKDFIYETEKMDRYNELRQQIIEPLLVLKEKINQNKTAIAITKCLYDFFQEQNLEEKITKKVQELEEKAKIDLANEYIASYKVILSLLDEIVLIFGEDKITLDQYRKILQIGLKNSELGKIPGTQDQVTFGDIDRSRSHKVKVVFIIGLNDGSFPSVNKEEGFLDDKDREYLKQDGIELAKGTLERLYEDNFNIYKAFTTAEEKIYLSYTSSDKEGKSLRPSMLIPKVKKLYPKLQERSDMLNKQYELVNEVVTYEQLLENIARLRDNKEILPMWYEIYQYYKKEANWQEKLPKDLQALAYTNLPQKLQKENVDKLYGNTLATSVSRLEKYRSCPFSYYLQYGLKLKEKENLKIHTFETGSFMHETIDEFFEEVREQSLGLAEIEEEQIQKIVSNIIDEKLGLSKNFIFSSTAKYKALVKRLKRIVSKALKYIIQTLIHSDFSVEGTEVEFGRKGDYPPIVLTLDDGKRVEITGKIDRIDTAIGEDGKYLRIIDYKSSSKNIDLNEVYAGLQIQLLTYSDAICKEKDMIPAGVFYFPLLEQIVKADKKITEEEIENLIQKNFKMKGLILADVKVVQMNDNTLTSGSSKLVPAAITTAGNIYERRTSGVNKEQFKILQDYIDHIIKEIAKEILSGKIDLKPYNRKGKTPCEYCEYQAICGFNVKQKDNTYRYIEKKSKEEILQKMKEER
jgi:ATP-dependent helicase/nuclease subunit B